MNLSKETVDELLGPCMSIHAVRKHLVEVTYKDYGSHLCTVWRTASSVDDSGTSSDGNAFTHKVDAEAHIATWLKSAACEKARAEMGWIIERGPDIQRTVDMNPHGLI